MADKLYYQQEGSEAIRSWALGQMLLGAGYALIGLLAFAAIWIVLLVVSYLLPEESKTAPPPMPTSAIEAPLDTTRAA
jgi:hypothetical protein